MKRVTVLGATGSVGRSTVDLLAREPDRFAVEALTAHRDVKALAAQAVALKAKRAVVADPAAYDDLKAALAGTGIEAAAGPDAVVEAAQMPADWVMSSIVGAAGLAPTLAAIRQGKTIGLANKETLVSAGALMTREVAKAGATLIPVDSEHSAIFQVFEPARADKVIRLILTASGGPFRTRTLDQMRDVTPEQAVAHPNWSMGAKISVDSATMMNKGLETIEAMFLFPVGAERIDVIVHPQSVVHSMVEYIDGSILAQLGTPDMRTPIAVALAWPDRMAAPVPRLDFKKSANLTFEDPDFERFPALRIARDALREGGAAPTLLNAANEVAVAAFLARRIGFLDIVACVEAVLAEDRPAAPGDLDAVAELDRTARRKAENWIKKAG
ncbi:MAG: 1-deoxy-D-xylulose-5-phosphate reductoisomerase [Alphaproteobacteria bacterium]|nr:1-deoxy-D-xylulose-5-phosphate reductoisomerase [Alphaproteobacteria bacterium]